MRSPRLARLAADNVGPLLGASLRHSRAVKHHSLASLGHSKRCFGKCSQTWREKRTSEQRKRKKSEERERNKKKKK